MSVLWWFVLVASVLVVVGSLFLWIRRARRTGTVLAARQPYRSRR